MTDAREALRERVAMKIAYEMGYTWGSSGLDHSGLRDAADAAIAICMEEAVKVAEGWVGCAEWSADTNSGYECASREIAAALRAYMKD